MNDRIVHRGRAITLQLETAELPGGRRVELEVARHPGASAIVPFESDDVVLLIRQYRHAVGDTIWEVPAGKLDGDTPEVCAAKELEEEVGRRPGHLELLASIYTSPGFTDEVIHLFAATQLTAVPQRLEEDEVIEVVPTPFDRALAMVFDGTIADAKSSLALLYAARRRGLLVGPG